MRFGAVNLFFAGARECGNSYIVSGNEVGAALEDDVVAKAREINKLCTVCVGGGYTCGGT